MIPEPIYRILSLGAGVQSSAVLLMSCLGELPKLDAAVFADTGWEPKAVYRHLEWLTAEGAKYGIPVHRVSRRNIKEDALVSQVRGRKVNGARYVSMPYFTLGPQGQKSMIKRQCTREYKLEPIRTWCRQFAGYKPRQRIPDMLIQQWIGISFDEWQRQRGAGERWRINWHPLVEARITRPGCLAWLAERGYGEPPRSACVGCPYRSNAEWRWLRDNEPESFEDACRFDEAIRNCGGMRGQMFLHRRCIPLREVDLRTDFERGQLSLFRDLCPTCMV